MMAVVTTIARSDQSKRTTMMGASAKRGMHCTITKKGCKTPLKVRTASIKIAIGMAKAKASENPWIISEKVTEVWKRRLEESVTRR